jgi:EAL domain-containing protein (putative c-di-GMP-specific phosphodiesterase class I)
LADAAAFLAVLAGPICGLCTTLDIPITAEGVETDAQQQALLDEQCGELQGFLIAPPAPLQCLQEWLK